MWCPDELKLNKFKKVRIPKNSDYFARFQGRFPSIPNGQYSGDASMPSMNMSKIDQLEFANKADLNAIRREAAEARNEDADSD